MTDPLATPPTGVMEEPNQEKSPPTRLRVFGNLILAVAIVVLTTALSYYALDRHYAQAVGGGAIGAMVNMMALSLNHKNMKLQPEISEDFSLEQSLYLCGRLIIGAASGFCVIAFFGVSVGPHVVAGTATPATTGSTETADLVLLAIGNARAVAIGLISGYSITVLDRLAKVLEGNFSKT